MFVGLKWFSIICCGVVHSTPGNNISTDSMIPDALSHTYGVGVKAWVRFDVASRLGSWVILSCSLCARSCTSWLSNSTICERVEFGIDGSVPGCM